MSRMVGMAVTVWYVWVLSMVCMVTSKCVNLSGHFEFVTLVLW